MRLIRSILGMLCAALLFPAVLLAGPPEGYPFVAYDQGLSTARSEGKPMFIYFGRQGCGFCEKTNQESFPDPRVRTRYSEHYALVYVDTESGERLTLPTGERVSAMRFAARIRANLTPVFVFMESDGTEIYRAYGYRTSEDFLDYDRYVHGGHYKTQDFDQFMQRGS